MMVLQVRNLKEKNWVIKEASDIEIKRLSAGAGISGLMSSILLNRGITDIDEVYKFLHPELKDLHDPFMLKDMDKAVDRIITAVNGRESITIYGDYDVDGVTSTSLLYRFLKELGIDALYYIPDRLEEGYGLSVPAMDKIKTTGTQLVITVDSGISAFDEIAHANSIGMEVIVTDHHECREQLPEALAVVNPCREDCNYPFRELAGAGVVFKLIQALSMRLSLGKLYLKYIDLAALATIADVVPLAGENRIIAKYGLEAIAITKNPGLSALIDVAGLTGKTLNTYSVGFGIAPRINAAGRVGDAERAVRMLVTDDTVEAGKLACELDSENKSRQEIEAEIFKQVVQIVESDIDLGTEKVIVAAGEGWHHGIIGIVASKITERYYRPSILISLEDGIGKGSGRSIEGFNLFKALTNCESFLDRFGGHELAAGLALKAENLPLFRRAMNEYADREIKEEDLVPRIKIDALVEPEDISVERAEELELLAPFGAGNPGPVLAYNCLRINDIRTVGEGKHLKLRLCSSSDTFDAIGFNLGEELSAISGFGSINAAFSMEINCWNNSRKVQLNLRDIKPFAAKTQVTEKQYHSRSKIQDKDYYVKLDKNIVFDGLNEYNINNSLPENLNKSNVRDIIPERDDVGAVYKYLKGSCSGKLETDDLFSVARLISEKYKTSINYFKLSKSIQILKELGLLEDMRIGETGVRIDLVEDGSRKTSLEKSVTFMGLQEMKKNVG